MTNRLLLCGAVMVFSAGCSPYFLNGSARTLQRGQIEYSGAASWTRVQRDGVAGPGIWYTMRGGITDAFELGGGVWDTGARVDAKISLLRPRSDLWGLNISLAPGGALFVDSASPSYDPPDEYTETDQILPNTHSVGALQLPVLLGWRLKGHEIVVGPRIIGEFLATQSPVARVGVSGGVSLRVSDIFRIMPEVAWDSDALWASKDDPTVALASHGHWTFAVSLTFDSRP